MKTYLPFFPGDREMTEEEVLAERAKKKPLAMTEEERMMAELDDQSRQWDDEE